MAKKRVWYGSHGPYFYEDSDQVNDPDGVVTSNQAGVMTEGKVTAQGAPETDEDAVRLAELPFGTIAWWYGNIGDIPSSWALCDGSNVTDRNGNPVATPDLTGYKIAGAGTYDLVYIMKL